MVGIIDITNVDSVHRVEKTECVGGAKGTSASIPKDENFTDGISL